MYTKTSYYAPKRISIYLNGRIYHCTVDLPNKIVTFEDNKISKLSFKETITRQEIINHILYDSTKHIPS